MTQKTSSRPDIMNAAQPPVCRAFDPAKWAYVIGAELLAVYGHAGRPGRAIIARWVRGWDAHKVIGILVRAGERERGDIVAYIESALRGERDDAEATTVADDEARERDRFARRVEGLRRVSMLHLLTRQDYDRAVQMGLLPEEIRPPQ